MPRPSSFVVYRGPSAYDPNRTIVAVLTGLVRPSANVKTGPMAQLFIIDYETAPHTAQKTGDDASVCGACPLRPSLAPEGKPCYVKTFQSPLSVWRAHRDAPVNLPGALAALARSGRKLRLGAYGDPAALPVSIVAALARTASELTVGGAVIGTRTKAWTGYTHVGERGPISPELSRYVMASAQSLEGAREYWGQGLRTFRVLNSGDTLQANEVLCPAYTHGTTCADCGLCDGTRPNDKRKSVAINAH